MSAKNATLVLSLDEGVTETVVEDTAGGVITRSENTRLSKYKGTTSRRPGLDVVLDVPPTYPDGDDPQTCGCIVPGPGRSHLAIFPPETGSKRIFGTSTEALMGPLSGTAGQNAYYPARIDFATSVDGGPVTETPATCIDNQGYQWTASMRQTSDLGVGLFVSVHLNGGTVVTSRKVIDIDTTLIGLFGMRFFCGITLAEFSVVLWFEQPTGIYAATATLDGAGTGLTVGAATLICLPQNPTASPGLWRPADVTSDRLSRAFLITRSTANKTSVQIREVNQTTLAVSNTFTINGTVGDTGSPTADTLHLAVEYWPASDKVIYAYSHSSGGGFTRYGVLTRTSGATVWHSIVTGDYGPCGIQPMTEHGVVYVAVASTLAGNVFTDQQRVGFTHRTLAAGAATGPLDFNLYWYQLQSRGGHYVQDQASFSEVYAYWSVMPSWGPLTQYSVPGDDAYVIDPSVEIITYGHGTYTPIARVGVDRASMRSPPRNGNSFYVHRYSAIASICYSEKRFDIPRNPISGILNQDGARIAMLSLRPTFTGITQSANGASFIASAMPAAWDGVEVVEAGPLHRMRLNVATTGGAGSASLTGTFYVVAVASFRDSAGNVHRSAPTLPFKVVLAGAKPLVTVTQPFTMRNGVTQERPTINLYWTLDGGAIFYQQPPILPPTWVSDPGYVQFSYIVAPTAVAGDRLYSTGAKVEPLLPECPPPAWDMQTIDGRVWLIDAEDRNVALPSLLKGDSQVTYEFNSTMRIASFDPQYGKLVAIAKFGETLIFAERCIWRVSGNGPDNSGQGQGFNDPQIVSYVGCRSRASVVQVPDVGVLFQADDGRMAIYAGAVKKFDSFAVYDVGTPSVHRQENEVIYPITDGSGFIVFNWVKGGWVHWPTATAVITASCTVPGVTLSAGLTGESLTTRSYFFQGDSLVKMDSSSVDTSVARPIVVERGWIAPESPQGDCCIFECWLQALHGGAPHDVTIRVAFDYNSSGDDGTYVEWTWPAAEVAQYTINGRYTLGLTCGSEPCRAAKVTVTATPVINESGIVGEIMQPLTLTVSYGAAPGLRRRTMQEGQLR